VCVSPNSARLFVGNLDFNVREEDLRKSFDKFGRIQSCIIIMDRDQPSKSRGFGFVQ
jgi:RNA recognition motif-containing protein